MLCLCGHRWKAEVEDQIIRKSSLEEGESSAPTLAALPWEKSSVQEAGLTSGPIQKARQISLSGFNTRSFLPAVSRYTDCAIGRLIKNSKLCVFSHSYKDSYMPHTRYSKVLKGILYRHTKPYCSTVSL